MNEKNYHQELPELTVINHIKCNELSFKNVWYNQFLIFRLELYKEYEQLLQDIGLNDSAVDKINSDDILIVVDMQNDFLPAADAPKGGRFGVDVF